MEGFAAGKTARMAAVLVGVHRKAAAYFYCRLRGQILIDNQRRAEVLGGSVELDESYFSGQRKGKRGRSAGFRHPQRRW